MNRVTGVGKGNGIIGRHMKGHRAEPVQDGAAFIAIERATYMSPVQLQRKRSGYGNDEAAGVFGGGTVCGAGVAAGGQEGSASG